MRRPPLLLSTAALLALSACAINPPRATPSVMDLTGFCADAQQLISGTQLRPENVLHTDYDAFVLSKPEVRPLRTEQYIWYEDDARTRPRMISCKMKTADHIATEYGAGQVSGEGMCESINRRTLARVLESMGAAERRRLAFDGGSRVVFDPEERTTDGPVWLKPYAFAYLGADGALHLKAKAMRNDWLDPRYAQAPARFKGTRYCHLVAPQYLARLLRAEIAPPAP
jgi:hypothetical protein